MGSVAVVSSGVSHATPSLTFDNISVNLSSFQNGLRSGQISPASLFVDGLKVYHGEEFGSQGLMVSSDGGQTFAARTTSDGLAGNAVNGIWASGSTIYAVGPSGLSTSTNSGQTFTSNAFGLSWSVFRDGLNVYVATQTGLRVSNDGGQNFTGFVDSSTEFGSNMVTDVHGSGGAIYVAVGLGGSPSGVFKSTDNGANFSATGLTSGSWREVFADNSNVYAVTQTGNLYISTNSGTTFTQRVLQVNQTDADVRDVWASGSTVYLATQFGLMVSIDGGANFTTYTTNEGLGSDSVWAIASGSGGSILAVTDVGLSIGSWPNPTVTAVSPSSGAAAGGTAITITGTNFASGATVTVGGAACMNVTVVNATEITCTTPAGTAGTASVVVTLNGVSNSANTLFTYNAPPTTTSTTVAAATATTVAATTTTTTTVAAVAAANTPTLVNATNQAALTRAPGSATALVNGVAVPVEVVSPVDSAAGKTAPEERTPAQVEELQKAADEMVDLLDTVAGGDSGLEVVETDTGAELEGVFPDENVPVEDIVVVDIDQSATLFAARDAKGEIVKVQPGAVLEVTPEGEVAVLAYGLPVGDAVELVIMSTPTLLGTYTVDASGSIETRANVPDSIGDGNHTLVVASPNVQAALGLKVSDSAAQALPKAGSGPSTTLVVLLLSIGCLMILLGRRPEDLVEA
jgi:hypothetical protein